MKNGTMASYSYHCNYFYPSYPTSLRTLCCLDWKNMHLSSMSTGTYTHDFMKVWLRKVKLMISVMHNAISGLFVCPLLDLLSPFLLNLFSLSLGLKTLRHEMLQLFHRTCLQYIFTRDDYMYLCGKVVKRVFSKKNVFQNMYSCSKESSVKTGQ